MTAVYGVRWTHMPNAMLTQDTIPGTDYIYIDPAYIPYLPAPYAEMQLTDGTVSLRIWLGGAADINKTTGELSNLGIAGAVQSLPAHVFEAGVAYLPITSPSYMTRLADAATIPLTQAGANQFDFLYPWIGLKRLTLSKSAVEVNTYGDATYNAFSTSDGQKMGRVPPFYSWVYIDRSSIPYTYEWYISETGTESTINLTNPTLTRTPSWQLNPAFGIGPTPKRLYVGSFEGSWDITGTKLESKAGARVASGKTLPQFRTAAMLNEPTTSTNGWGLMDAHTLAALQLLMIIKYANLNVQGSISHTAQIMQNASQGSTTIHTSTPTGFYVGMSIHVLDDLNEEDVTITSFNDSTGNATTTPTTSFNITALTHGYTCANHARCYLAPAGLGRGISFQHLTTVQNYAMDTGASASDGNKCVSTSALNPHAVWMPSALVNGVGYNTAGSSTIQCTGSNTIGTRNGFYSGAKLIVMDNLNYEPVTVQSANTAQTLIQLTAPLNHSYTSANFAYVGVSSPISQSCDSFYGIEHLWGNSSQLYDGILLQIGFCNITQTVGPGDAYIQLPSTCNITSYFTAGRIVTISDRILPSGSNVPLSENAVVQSVDIPNKRIYLTAPLSRTYTYQPNAGVTYNIPWIELVGGIAFVANRDTTPANLGTTAAAIFSSPYYTKMAPANYPVLYGGGCIQDIALSTTDSVFNHLFFPSAVVPDTTYLSGFCATAYINGYSSSNAVTVTSAGYSEGGNYGSGTPGGPFYFSAYYPMTYAAPAYSARLQWRGT